MKLLSERVLEEKRVSLSLAWKPVMTREEISAEVAQLEAENEALWMYYKANRDLDFDLFKKAEKKMKALGVE